MLEGKGRVVNRPTKTDGKEYDKFYIYIPSSLVRDSAFPFKAGDEIIIRIDPENNLLTVSKSD